MSLAGGDPEAMSLNRFLDVAYAVLVEEYVRMGSGVLEAVERTAEYAAGYKPVPAGGNEALAETPPALALVDDVAAQNDQALMQLEAMMSGVGGVPR